jgi:hypothetical protein
MNYAPYIIIAIIAFTGMWVASGSPIKAGITIVQCCAILGMVWLLSIVALA